MDGKQIQPSWNERRKEKDEAVKSTVLFPQSKQKERLWVEAEVGIDGLGLKYVT